MPSIPEGGWGKERPGGEEAMVGPGGRERDGWGGEEDKRCCRLNQGNQVAVNANQFLLNMYSLIAFMYSLNAFKYVFFNF